MSILDEIRNLSPEDRKLLIKYLRKLAEEDKPQPVVKQLGEPFDMRSRNERGGLLSEEEIYDRAHPLKRRPYGYYESCQDITGKKTRKVWTRAEIDAFNKPIEEAWLNEKKKFFPDAVLPPNPGVAPESRFSDPRYTHPMMNND